MKIYQIPVSQIVRPQTGFVAPAHNQDYGVEQDFELWLQINSKMATKFPNEADWYYFQPFYNRFYCNHWGDHSELIQEEILEKVDPDFPTFTVAEYDLKAMHPDFDFRNMEIFTASRRANNGSIDIPLLCSRHSDLPTVERTWKASFCGKFETSGYREEMRQALIGRDDVNIIESAGLERYVRLLADTWVTLAPRGFGGQTFRFYEAMQFGSIPFLIGDMDTRPFPEFLDWDACSLFTDDVGRIGDILDSLTMADLVAMSDEARAMFEKIHYQNWCNLVIKRLELEML